MGYGFNEHVLILHPFCHCYNAILDRVVRDDDVADLERGIEVSRVTTLMLARNPDSNI